MTKTFRKKTVKSKKNGTHNDTNNAADVTHKKVRQSDDTRDMFDDEDEEIEPANEKSDEEGSPILDDLRDEDRAGVLELVHVLVVRAEALFGDIYGELPLAPSRRS